MPILDDAALSALLATCKGNTFENRRDTAIIRLLLDTGMRAGELYGLRVGDVDFEHQVALVVGKGGRNRACPFGSKSADALRRYLRFRGRHDAAETPPFWLGKKGRMTDSGVRQMLERRCVDAGIPPVHPHQFRHAFARDWLAAGGQEHELMRLAGWRSREMVGRYAASAADGRARDAHRLPRGSALTWQTFVGDLLLFVRVDDGGIELEIIAVPDDRNPETLAVIHLMPTEFRKGRGRWQRSRRLNMSSGPTSTSTTSSIRARRPQPQHGSSIADPTPGDLQIRALSGGTTASELCWVRSGRSDRDRPASSAEHTERQDCEALMLAICCDDVLGRGGGARADSLLTHPNSAAPDGQPVRARFNVERDGLTRPKLRYSRCTEVDPIRNDESEEAALTTKPEVCHEEMMQPV